MFFYILYIIVLIQINHFCWHMIILFGFTTCIEDILHINAQYLSWGIGTALIILPFVEFIIKKEFNIGRFCKIGFAIATFIVVLDLGLSLKFRTFDKELWRTYPNQRRIMYIDLREKGTLEGMNADEVESLLGKPDSEIELVGEEKSKIMIYNTNKSSTHLYIYIRTDKYNKIEIIS